MMDFFDYLIIYLTFGAPLGVFYFLQNRKKQNQIQVWLKTIFTFIFWLPFAARLLENKLRRKFGKRNDFFKEAKIKKEIFLFRKQIEKTLEVSGLKISIFEFREIFERYVGLTLAKNNKPSKTTESEKEVFRFQNKINAEIGAICLNRRNLERLTFHQNLARQDFFQIIVQLIACVSDEENFIEAAADFFRLLKDFKARSAVEKLLFDYLRAKNPIADRSENLLWSTEICEAIPHRSNTIH